MADTDSPRAPLTVQLPADLVRELQTLAREKRVSVDEVVMEACLAYTEPYLWERRYREWRRDHPNEPLREVGPAGPT
jgi:hypothetical protein